MKKICILSVVNIKHMTMISLYTSYLEENNIPYDIIYIDKYDEYEKINALNIYKYKLAIDRNWPKYIKIIKYWGFRRYAKNIIKKEKYDFIIVWNNITATMFADILIRQYKYRYCLNIRDYFYEKNPLVYKLSKKIIGKSAFATISSEGFKKFLPPHDYITVHSFNEDILKYCTQRDSLRSRGEIIRISFIGYVRFFETDKKLIDALGNDPRFIVQYFGEGSHVLETYAKNKGYKNVKFRGRFEPQQTAEFLNVTDIINNLYGNGKVELDTAISIKTYYAAFLKIPILVYKNTFMSEVTRGFNIIADPNDSNFADDLYRAYRNLDFNELNRSCEAFINNARASNEKFHKTLQTYVGVGDETAE